MIIQPVSTLRYGLGYHISMATAWTQQRWSQNFVTTWKNENLLKVNFFSVLMIVDNLDNIFVKAKTYMEKKKTKPVQHK